MKVATIAVAALVAVVVPGRAHAAGATGCKITGIVAPGVSALYDPFDASFTPSPVSISIQTQGEGCSGAKLELALAPTVTSPGKGPRVRLEQGGSEILATVLVAGQSQNIVNPNAAFASNPLLLSVGSAGSIAGDASLAIDLKTGQVGAPGTYVATLQMLARLTDSHGNESTVDTQVNLAVTIKPSVRVATGSGQLAIDLGELTAGAIGGPVTFDAYSNVDYNLMLSSDNGFIMRRGGSGSAPGVPYTPVLADGTLQTTSGGAGLAVRQAVFNTPAQGMRHHSLSVKVEPFSGLGAGDYSDVMTLEIRARV